MKEGEGYVQSPHGTYQGQWSKDLKHGQGQLILANGTEYLGEFKNDHFQEGRVQMSNGDIYEGMLENWQKTGKGSYHYRQGGKYQGDWHGNQKVGQCKFNILFRSD